MIVSHRNDFWDKTESVNGELTVLTSGRDPTRNVLHCKVIHVKVKIPIFMNI